MPLNKICESCESVFSVHIYRAKSARYCSYRCMGKGKIRPQESTITCTGCSQVKDADSFSWTTLRGEKRRRVRCKQCEKRARDAKVSEMESGPPRACSGCGRTKAASCFYGMAAACKVCVLDRQKLVRDRRADDERALEREYHRDYYQANREAAAERARRFEATEKGKAGKRVAQARRRGFATGAPGHFASADIVRLWHRQRGECAACGVKCGKRPADSGAYHVDHIMPLARGGSNWPRNLQILCPACNCSKGAKTEAEFRRYRMQART